MPSPQLLEESQASAGLQLQNDLSEISASHFSFDLQKMSKDVKSHSLKESHEDPHLAKVTSSLTAPGSSASMAACPNSTESFSADRPQLLALSLPSRLPLPSTDARSHQHLPKRSKKLLLFSDFSGPRSDLEEASATGGTTPLPLPADPGPAPWNLDEP